MDTNKQNEKRECSGDQGRGRNQKPTQARLQSFLFHPLIRASNASLSAIRAHLGNLTRYAHHFRAAFGTLSRFARLWLVPPPPRTGPDAWLWLVSHQPRKARSLLKNSYTYVFKLAAIF